MIAIDWGTSSFRAFRLGADGQAIARVETSMGILNVSQGGFPATLREAVGAWLAGGETRVLMSGMVGSRQGWIEAPYCPCPAGAAEIAASVCAVPFEDAQIFIVPGLSAQDASGTPEVMRGEETQIIGAGAEGLVCLPGSHAKWVRVADGRITGFETYLSGEAFAAIRSGTILGRMMVDGPPVEAAFDEGLARSDSPGHLLHHLFGVRSLGLFGQLHDSASASYLSGLLIGHEIRAALQPGDHVTLLGAPALCALYARAIGLCGGIAAIGPADCAAAGLARIGESIAWT